MGWLHDTSLRDLEDDVVLEATCRRCAYVWLQSPVQLLLKVSHRDVRLDEVAANLACPKTSCRHVGVRLLLLRCQNSSSFVGGMP